jgi:hypothetical protein
LRGVCERVVYGPGWKWLGEVKDGDIVRVSGQDQNLNQLERTIHVGGATSGGTVEGLEQVLLVEALNDDDVFIKPGDFHEFNARISNLGGAEGHVNLLTNTTTESGRALAATGFKSYWTDTQGQRTDHVVVPPGSDVTLKVRVQTDKDTPEDHYYLQAIIEYDNNGVAERKSFDAIIDVNENASGNHQHHHNDGLSGTPTNETAAPLNTTEGGGSPNLTALATVGLGLTVLVIMARRRDD